MIEVILPAPLLRLARTENPVSLTLTGELTQRTLLGALEAKFPALLGTTRDRDSGKRRAYVRFYAGGEDLSNAAPDDPLPAAVASGEEPFVVLGALSGG